MDGLISRQAAIDALKAAYWDKNIQSAKDDPCVVDAMTDWAIRQVKALPSAQPDVPDTNVGDMISRQAAIDALREVYEYEYPTASGGFDEYATKLVPNTLKNLPSAQPEIIRCKDCRHFHYDMPYVIQDIPVLGHEVCDFWGDGCKTSENGFCSYAKRRTDG